MRHRFRLLVVTTALALLLMGADPDAAEAAPHRLAAAATFAHRSSPLIRDLQLRNCIAHEQAIEGKPVRAHPRRIDLARLTRLDCPQPAHIHGWTIDFREVAYGRKLTFIRYWSDAPAAYEDLSPLAKLKRLTTLYKNLGRCTLPIAASGGQCVPA